MVMVCLIGCLALLLRACIRVGKSTLVECIDLEGHYKSIHFKKPILQILPSWQ
jgi:hypothetical protein